MAGLLPWTVPELNSGWCQMATVQAALEAARSARSHYGASTPLANSQVVNGAAYGVMKLTLHADSYDWQFVPEAGKTFTDTGVTLITDQPQTGVEAKDSAWGKENCWG